MSSVDHVYFDSCWHCASKKTNKTQKNPPGLGFFCKRVFLNPVHCTLCELLLRSVLKVFKILVSVVVTEIPVEPVANNPASLIFKSSLLPGFQC